MSSGKYFEFLRIKVGGFRLSRQADMLPRSFAIMRLTARILHIDEEKGKGFARFETEPLPVG
uniref:Uncharacterized protein n=1 Tax=Candidatus Kentrum sp. SD TaxID=2126332 RepID=A0A450YFB5_9GAMM|nr:MAG: hypothetical protein BECKSD772F_GA0070984_100424 [Candidatus Kentron sp. SD]VFK40219.1 MAG: hypothetical protein BECKSD772E_GA0070983_100524 [Candidatus Kentron sp. SD]